MTNYRPTPGGVACSMRSQRLKPFLPAANTSPSRNASQSPSTNSSTNRTASSSKSIRSTFRSCASITARRGRSPAFAAGLHPPPSLTPAPASAQSPSHSWCDSHPSSACNQTPADRSHPGSPYAHCCPRAPPAQPAPGHASRAFQSPRSHQPAQHSSLLTT
jgi:hypothetical protein